MFSRLLLIPLAILALMLAVIACGDDDDDGGGDQTAATTAPADDGDDDGDDDNGGDDDDGGSDGGGFGTGAGTLTIGDETWEVTGVGCVFSAEEARNPDFPFNLAGSAESSTGERLHVAADIYDPSGQERHEGEGVSHQIEIYDFNFEDPTVSWTTIPGLLAGGEDAFIAVDGKSVRGEGLFDDNLTEDEFEAIPGTLEVSCP